MEITVRCPNCKSNVPLGYPICPYCGFDLRSIIRLRARRELTKWDILSRVKKSLLTPWRIYDDILIAPDGIGPIVIIFIFSLLSALRTIVLLARMLDLYEYFSLNLLIPLSIVAGFFLYFITWIIVSIYVNFIVKILGSRPDMVLTRSITGYAAGILLIPMLIASFTISIVPSISDQVVLANTSWLSRMIMFVGTIAYSLILSDGVSRAYLINRGLFFLLLIPLPIATFLLF